MKVNVQHSVVLCEYPASSCEHSLQLVLTPAPAKLDKIEHKSLLIIQGIGVTTLKFSRYQPKYIKDQRVSRGAFMIHLDLCISYTFEYVSLLLKHWENSRVFALKFRCK